MKNLFLDSQAARQLKINSLSFAQEISLETPTISNLGWAQKNFQQKKVIFCPPIEEISCMADNIIHYINYDWKEPIRMGGDFFHLYSIRNTKSKGLKLNKNIIMGKLITIIDFVKRMSPNDIPTYISFKMLRAVTGDPKYCSIYKNLLTKWGYLKLFYPENTKYVYTSIGDKEFFDFYTLDYFQENKKLQAYLDNYLNQLFMVEDNAFNYEHNEAVIKLGASFVASYDNSLRQLAFPNDVLEFIYNLDDDTKSKCLNSMRWFSTIGTITKVDAANRIYSPVFNMPKVLRKKLNYNFSVDVHNSHPLILCLLLREYYQRHNNSICYILDSVLNNKRIICSPNNDNLPEDVVEYISLTESGKLWDMLVQKTGLKRDEVKSLCFQNILYSRQHHCNLKNPFVAVFNKYFPNVIIAVEGIRQEIKQYCIDRHLYKPKKKEWRWNGDLQKLVEETVKFDVDLSTLIMRIEAKIMISALTRLYREYGDHFFSIFDAIYCVGTTQVSPKKVKATFSKRFAAIGLKPSFGIEIKNVGLLST